MSYAMSRVWHRNTSKAGKVDILPDVKTMADGRAAILEREASDPNAEERLRDYSTRITRGLAFDFRDYTYQLIRR